MTPPTPDAPLVSVLVPVLDEVGVLRDTAAAMLGQRLDGPLEVLLVDGGSTDGTRSLLDELAAADERVVVLDNPARIVPAALNVGLRHARGRYVARMDAHSWYPPTYLADGIARLEAGGVAWVTGPAVPRAGGRWSRRVAAALGSPLGRGGSRKWRARGEDGDAAGPDEIELDTGVFAGVWRRRTLEALGGWDERFTVNEDAEMAGRVLERGERIVCVPSMAAEYAPRETLGGLWRQYWRFGFFRVRTAHLHPRAVRRQHLGSAGLAAVALAALVPGRAGAVPRRLLGVYAAALAALTARARRERLGDVAGVPVVLATMHLSWGLGFLAACVRHGPPWRGVVRAVRGAGD